MNIDKAALVAALETVAPGLAAAGSSAAFEHIWFKDGDTIAAYNRFVGISLPFDHGLDLAISPELIKLLKTGKASDKLDIAPSRDAPAVDVKLGNRAIAKLPALPNDVMSQYDTAFAIGDSDVMHGKIPVKLKDLCAVYAQAMLATAEDNTAAHIAGITHTLFDGAVMIAASNGKKMYMTELLDAEYDDDREGTKWILSQSFTKRLVQMARANDYKGTCTVGKRAMEYRTPDGTVLVGPYLVGGERVDFPVIVERLLKNRTPEAITQAMLDGVQTIAALTTAKGKETATITSDGHGDICLTLFTVGKSFIEQRFECESNARINGTIDVNALNRVIGSYQSISFKTEAVVLESANGDFFMLSIGVKTGDVYTGKADNSEYAPEPPERGPTPDLDDEIPF